jgi:pimeloyl-ACP methyl ester carboxylesterase
MTKIARFMFVSITVCIVTVIAVLYFLQDSLIFPAPEFDVAAVKISGFKSVAIPTPDGETLSAYYHPANDSQQTILVFHGNGDAAAYQQIKAKALMDAGFGVLLVEYRGYGGSTGSPSEAGLFIDGNASYDFVRKLSEQPIGLYAHSLGTGVAIHLASERITFALVLESPFDSILAIAQKQMPFIPMGLFLKHKFHSIEIVGQIDAPILIMHGNKDRVIPIEHGRRLKNAAPANTVFLEITGAGHNNLLEFGVVKTAIDFFNKAMSDKLG